MKQTALHAVAFAAFSPLVLVTCEDVSTIIFGLLYALALGSTINRTKAGRRFLRRYYREILRLENSLR